MWSVLSGRHGAVSVSVCVQARGCVGEAYTPAPAAVCWLWEQELGCRVTPGVCGQTRGWFCDLQAPTFDILVFRQGLEGPSEKED